MPELLTTQEPRWRKWAAAAQSHSSNAPRGAEQGLLAQEESGWAGTLNLKRESACLHVCFVNIALDLGRKGQVFKNTHQRPPRCIPSAPALTQGMQTASSSLGRLGSRPAAPGLMASLMVSELKACSWGLQRNKSVPPWLSCGCGRAGGERGGVDPRNGGGRALSCTHKEENTSLQSSHESSWGGHGTVPSLGSWETQAWLPPTRKQVKAFAATSKATARHLWPLPLLLSTWCRSWSENSGPAGYQLVLALL